jgi:hypothetical protein
MIVVVGFRLGWTLSTIRAVGGGVRVKMRLAVAMGVPVAILVIARAVAMRVAVDRTVCRISEEAPRCGYSLTGWTLNAILPCTSHAAGQSQAVSNPASVLPEEVDPDPDDQ